MSQQPIENYGIIGDLHTVALVGVDGSIDFLSFPRFDSPTVFAALLDGERGGRFQVSPMLGEARRKQMYLPDTNILMTRFLSDEGVGEVIDFMPVGDHGRPHAIIRQVRTIRGDVRYRMVCDPRFDYARAGREVERRGGEVLFVSAGAPAPRRRPPPGRRGRCRRPLRARLGAVHVLHPRERERKRLAGGLRAARLVRACLRADRGLLAALDRALDLPGPLA